jgi:hypothetical protein
MGFPHHHRRSKPKLRSCVRPCSESGAAFLFGHTSQFSRIVFLQCCRWCFCLIAPSLRQPTQDCGCYSDCISHPTTSKFSHSFGGIHMQWPFTTSRISVLVAALLCAAVGAIPADVGNQKVAAPAVEDRRLVIRSGTLFTKEGVPISLSGFDADIQSDKPQPSETTVTPKQIKDVVVRSGSAFVRAQDLSRLLKTRIKNDSITDLAVETSGVEMKISGHVKKVIPVHFEIKGPVSLTQNGFIDLHESSMKVDRLSMKGLSEMLGMDPEHMIGDSSKGLEGTKNDILFDPNALWGMSVHGKLTGVKIVNDGLMLVYGTSHKPAAKQTKIASLSR